MSVIPESGMNFGKYDEKDLFHIETSEIYKKLGDGIPTVEFILKYNGNNIVFLEAKKSCPNVANRYESKEKELKFEEYYGSITEKFISSLQIYLAAIMNRYQDTSEIGDNLRSVSNMKDVKLKFILVVKNAEDITWLAGPLAELRARLLKVRKIWGVEVVVLNEELAGDDKMAKIRIIKKNNDCSMEYEVGDICEVTGTWYGGVHINGRSGIPVSLDKEEYMELNTEPEEPDSAENENTLETPEHDIHAGDIVQHFKREWVSPDTSEYLYKVLAVAHHTENGEKLMIYQALYAPFKICARPYDMFMSEVDREKYPDIKQKYRFEKYTTK